MTFKSIIQNMVHNKVIEKARRWYLYGGDWDVTTLLPEDIDLKKDKEINCYDTDGYIGVTAVNVNTKQVKNHLAWAFVQENGEISVYFAEA